MHDALEGHALPGVGGRLGEREEAGDDGDGRLDRVARDGRDVGESLSLIAREASQRRAESLDVSKPEAPTE